MQDYSKLPEDLKAKLLKWESNSPSNKQVQLLSDIVDISHEMLNVVDSQGKNSDETTKKFGAILVDMREQLSSLNAKESPETPDNSKPVIDAIYKLERALTGSIKAIDTKPNVTVPAPVVNVDAPNVTLDNKEIADILRNDLPTAFNKAIKGISIPKTDNSNVVKSLTSLSEKLDSIDVGVRLKPQAPTKIAVTNLDGTPIGSTSQVTKRFDTSSSTILYTATAPVGTADSSLGWTITKFDLTNSSDSSGKVATDVSWTDRSLGSYN
jgi:hypothetical protein